MPEQKEHRIVRAVIAADRTSAELIVSAESDRSSINEPLCLTTILEAGIEINDDVSKELQIFIKKAKALPGKIVAHQIAKASPPIHGIDGDVQWLENDQQTNSDQHQHSHYQRSAYVIVKAGDTIGKYIAPQEGTDGRDVTGKTIPAKEPLKCKINIDPTIKVTTEGDLIAEVDGVLAQQDNVAKIEQLLIVDENVDFATGNIDFLGDIEIRRDIRDRFVVKATGDISVNGFIEDATIHCGGSLTTMRGYAGRTRAEAVVMRDLKTKYLDNVDVEIGRDLFVSKEVINSRLIVHGEIKSPDASFIGGSLKISKAFNALNIGSAGNTKTVIFLGSVPKLQPFMDEINDIIDQFNEHHKIIQQEIDRLDQLSKQGKLTAQDAERHTECVFDAQHIESSLGKANPMRENLDIRINSYKDIHVKVNKSIYQNVSFVLGKTVYTTNQTIKGPVEIFEDTSKQLIIQRTGATPKPLSDYTTISSLK